MQRHNSNRLHISTDSKCWMCSIKSFCMWPSPDSHARNRLYRLAKILRVLMRRFSYIRSTLFSLSFSVLCPWHPAMRVTLGKEPLYRRYWWTRMNTLRTRFRPGACDCRFSSWPSLVLALHDSYIRCIFTYDFELLLEFDPTPLTLISMTLWIALNNSYYLSEV
jgi:hypothetical protein